MRLLKLLILFRLAAVVFLTIVALWIVSAVAVFAFAMRDTARPSDAIVVLGAAQYDGRPSPVLKARIDHALKLFNRKLAPRLIVTGGRGEGDTTSEAAVARNYALRRGVPDSAILLESSGRTTEESIRGVASILEERDLSSAVLVSDPAHMFRLWVLAHRFGFTPHTSPTRTSPKDPNRRVRWRYMFQESLKAPAALFLEESVAVKLLPPVRKIIPDEISP
ncbi:MAG: YdcF family protein [Gemmatimonadaceae bacterium]